MSDLEAIRQKKVLAVEGRDEENFFDALMKYLSITDVEIEVLGGKEQFREKLPALVKSSGFSDVEVFAVVRDADVDAYAAFESVRRILQKESSRPPEQMNQFSEGKPVVGVFIMPGDSDEGMLEDLCLRTVKEHPAMACVDGFIDCILQLENHPHNMTKARAQAFLAAMPQIVNSVGIGAKKGYWKFDSDELTDLRSFIERLR